MNSIARVSGVSTVTVPRDENSFKETAPRDVPATTPSIGDAMADFREHFIEQAMADYESPLIGYAHNILHDIDTARDVVQDTFLRLCQQDLHKFGEGLKTWLFTVCRNRAFDVLRKEKRVEPLGEENWNEVVSSDISPDVQAELDERHAEILRLLDRLSGNQREVILLKFQQGLSYREIEEVTGLTSGNIGFLIHTGLKRLRAWMTEES